MADQSILDFMENLPDEHKRALTGHIIKTILGVSTPPLVFAKPFTMSNDVPEEEQIRLLAETYGVDVLSLDGQLFADGIKKYLASKLRIKEIIGHHYNYTPQPGQRTKNDEVLDLGKFLYTTGFDYQFEPREEPDFTLAAEGLEIGLEHTVLQAPKDTAYEAEITKKYINEVVITFLKDNPALKGLVNITLDMELPVFEGKTLRDFKSPVIKSNTVAICQAIAGYINAMISGSRCDKPLFIRSFNYQPSNETFAIRHNLEFFARSDFKELFKGALAKKEKRLVSYKEKTALGEWWLLMVYNDGNYSSHFKTVDRALKEPVSSNFDRIFILNGFDLGCYELKAVRPYVTDVGSKRLKEFTATRNSTIF